MVQAQSLGPQASQTHRLKAKITVARKLAVILHRVWRDETDFIWSSKVAAT
jgi:hypothetical protein